MRYLCIRWGNWMVRDWHLYHYVKVQFGKVVKYTRFDWRKIL